MKKFNFVLCIFTVVLIFILSKNIYARLRPYNCVKVKHQKSH